MKRDKNEVTGIVQRGTQETVFERQKEDSFVHRDAFEERPVIGHQEWKSRGPMHRSKPTDQVSMPRI